MIGHGFRGEWLKEYARLEYNETKGQMNCRVVKIFKILKITVRQFVLQQRYQSFHVSKVEGHKLKTMYLRNLNK